MRRVVIKFVPLRDTMISDPNSEEGERKKQDNVRKVIKASISFNRLPHLYVSLYACPHSLLARWGSLGERYQGGLFYKCMRGGIEKKGIISVFLKDERIYKIKIGQWGASSNSDGSGTD